MMHNASEDLCKVKGRLCTDSTDSLKRSEIPPGSQNTPTQWAFLARFVYAH